MKKLAIFVEGMTERVFVEQLVRQCVEEKKLKISRVKLSGGSRGLSRTITVTYVTPDTKEQEFHVQIMESGADNRVASDLRDSYDGLVSGGFGLIIGIRDVRPDHTLGEVPLLRRLAKYRMKTKPIDPLIVLAVLEVEAWFLAEHNHYEKIHPDLSCAHILATLGFDPVTGDMTARAIPSDDLNAIYKLVGLSYRKKGRQIERTVDVLDYEYVYCEMVDRFEDLKNLIGAIDGFFMPVRTDS